jgi:hypothetical protein
VWLLVLLLLLLQAPHVHFLLLEAADILGLHPLPQVHVLQAAAPFVHMLHVPTARLPAADSSSVSQKQQQQQQQGEVYSRQRQVLLVVSSAALQLLQPAELQAAMAGALTPALLAGQGEQLVGSARNVYALRVVAWALLCVWHLIKTCC